MLSKYMHSPRPPNLTDCFRLVAALAVIFLHASYPADFSYDTQQLIMLLQQIFASWAVPFFYVATARFALASSLRNLSLAKVMLRSRNLLLLVLLYTLLLALLYLGNFVLEQKAHAITYIQQALLPEKLSETLVRLGAVLTQLNPTSAHFLLHTIVITLVAYGSAWILKRTKAKRSFQFLLLCTLISSVLLPEAVLKMYPHYFEVPYTLLITICVGFLYELWQKPTFPVKQNGTGILLFNLLLLPILVLGIPTAAWHSILFHKSILVVFGVVVLYSTDYFAHLHATNFVAYLSHWGQRYSLGMLVIHPLIIKVYAILIPGIFSSLHPHPIVVVFAIFLATAVTSFYITRILVSKIPWTVSI